MLLLLTLKSPVCLPSPCPPESQARASKYMELTVRVGIKACLHHLVGHLWSTCYRWCAACRSFRGHIRTEFARGWPLLGLGSAPLREYPDGSLHVAPETLARCESIESLSAKHPWVDIVALRMFLMGFDAGEQYARRTQDTETDKQSGPLSSFEPPKAN